MPLAETFFNFNYFKESRLNVQFLFPGIFKSRRHEQVLQPAVPYLERDAVSERGPPQVE